MRLDLAKVKANIEAATTEDLLDRATVYRDGMEAEALVLIDQALWERGVSEEARVEHEARRRQEVIQGPDGQPVRCARCDRPAVVQGWYPHRLWGVLPLFPRKQAFCAEHRPG